MSARILTAVSLLLTAAACGAQGSSGAGGGIFGTVRVSPSTPACRAGSSCSRPAGGFRLVFLRNGKRVASTAVDARGRYRVTLERGRYVVRPALATALRKQSVEPGTISVPSGRFARRDFLVDTGIR